MLSEEEKTKIGLEEKYRQEIASKFKTKSSVQKLETGLKLLQSLAIIVGILGTWLAYVNQNRERQEHMVEESRQTSRDMRKEFYERQLNYYAEAAAASSTLATEEKGSPDYIAARKDFDRLYHGRLAIVEDSTVEESMVGFLAILEFYENTPTASEEDRKEDLQDQSLILAHAIGTQLLAYWKDTNDHRTYNQLKERKGDR